jgi:hypothetical protein
VAGTVKGCSGPQCCERTRARPFLAPGARRSRPHGGALWGGTFLGAPALHAPGGTGAQGGGRTRAGACGRTGAGRFWVAPALHAPGGTGARRSWAAPAPDVPGRDVPGRDVPGRDVSWPRRFLAALGRDAGARRWGRRGIAADRQPALRLHHAASPPTIRYARRPDRLLGVSFDLAQRQPGFRRGFGCDADGRVAVATQRRLKKPFRPGLACLRGASGTAWGP